MTGWAWFSCVKWLAAGEFSHALFKSGRLLMEKKIDSVAGSEEHGGSPWSATPTRRSTRGFHNRWSVGKERQPHRSWSSYSINVNYLSKSILSETCEGKHATMYCVWASIWIWLDYLGWPSFPSSSTKVRCVLVTALPSHENDRWKKTTQSLLSSKKTFVVLPLSNCQLALMES